MRTKETGRVLTGILLTLVVASLATFCSGETKEKAEVKNSMVVVFVAGDAKVVKGGSEVDASVGLVVDEQDQIRTTDGRVDLQTRGGSAVRIREFTTVTVSSIAGAGQGNTDVRMEHGSLMANVQRSSADEGFNLITPTAIAGVRGTTFTVEFDDLGSPTVKVIDGSVSLAPRVAALESVTEEEFAASDSLRELRDLSQREIIIEERQEATLDRRVAEQVVLVNSVVEEAVRTSRSESRVNVEFEAPAREISRNLIRQSSEEPVAVKRDVEITFVDLYEKETLVTVTPEIIEQVIAGGSVEEAAAQITTDRDSKAVEDTIIARIEEQAQQVQLTSTAEIERHYNNLELIVLTNGERLTGAVIAQTGNLLVIHTTDGVRRVPRSEVEYQAFPD